MRAFLLSLCGIVALLTTGCQTTPVPATASGKPEVTIKTGDTAQVKAALIGEFVNWQFQVIDDSAYQVTMRKQWEGMGANFYQAMAGNSYSSQPWYELRITFVSTPNTVRAITNIDVNMENGFGRNDKRNQMDAKTRASLQSVLDKVKVSIEGAPVAVTSVVSKPTVLSSETVRADLLKAANSGTQAEFDAYLKVAKQHYGVAAGEKLDGLKVTVYEQRGWK